MSLAKRTETISKATVAEQYKSSSNLEARISLHERFSVNQYGWLPWVFDHFDLPPDASVLEVGCGVGKLWQLNAHRISPGWRITLSDFSPGMLETARQNTESINGHFTHELVDIPDIPFANQTFDAVIANHMLYYLSDKARRSQVIAGVRGVIRKGGRFYATTNGVNHMREMVELVRQFDASIPFVIPIVQNFSLETGPIEVAEWFGEVELRRYSDGLLVTDADALIEYILSVSTVFSLPAPRKAALSDFVRRWMENNGGAIKIQKDSGLIRARRVD
jgi:ubiquinone/menaquinone biosynthesis C-methylase UbiE